MCGKGEGRRREGGCRRNLALLEDGGGCGKEKIMEAEEIMRTFVICFQYTLGAELTESGGRNCPTLPDEKFEINYCCKITLMSCVFV